MFISSALDASLCAIGWHQLQTPHPNPSPTSTLTPPGPPGTTQPFQSSEANNFLTVLLLPLSPLFLGWNQLQASHSGTRRRFG